MVVCNQIYTTFYYHCHNIYYQSLRNKMSALSRFAKQSIKPEVIPLLVIVGGALTGAAYIGLHAAKAPDVTWYVYKAIMAHISLVVVTAFLLRI